MDVIYQMWICNTQPFALLSPSGKLIQPRRLFFTYLRCQKTLRRLLFPKTRWVQAPHFPSQSPAKTLGSPIAEHMRESPQGFSLAWQSHVTCRKSFVKSGGPNSCDLNKGFIWFHELRITSHSHFVIASFWRFAGCSHASWPQSPLWCSPFWEPTKPCSSSKTFRPYFSAQSNLTHCTNGPQSEMFSEHEFWSVLVSFLSQNRYVKPCETKGSRHTAST